jgi:hypothetical protein
MPRFIEGQDRHQVTLLPESLDDFIARDNAVRVVDAFVNELDLQALGFQGTQPAETGRPSYHPSVLLKIYIYDYLSRLPSLTLAPVTMSDNGTPRPSTNRCRLLPFFSPVRRVRVGGFLREWCFHHRPVYALPSPDDAGHLVVLSQPGLPQRLEEASTLPL